MPSWFLRRLSFHLAQFCHKYRLLAQAVDYVHIFIYDEAQQEAALSDLAILGALSRKCFVLHLSDSKQTSGGTGSSHLARQVRHISDPACAWNPCCAQAVPSANASNAVVLAAR